MTSVGIPQLTRTLRHEVQAFTADPDGRLENLWSAVDKLDREVCEEGVVEEGLSELIDAVQELRQLATRHDAALPVLAAALDTLTSPYWNRLQYEEVVPLAEERAAIFRSLAASTSGQYYADAYRRALHHLGRTLYLAGHQYQALAALDEAVAMARAAAAANSLYARDLANCLATQRSCLITLKRHEDAVAIAEEIVTLETKLRLGEPNSDQKRLADAIGVLGRCLNKAGRYAPAVTATHEALTLYRRLVVGGALDAHYDVAETLDSLRWHLEGAGQVAEAIAACREEIALRRGLPIRDGRTDAVDLAAALDNLAFLLRESGQLSGLLPTAQEALSRYRALASAGQVDYPDMWGGLDRMANLVRDQLTAERRYSEALADAREHVAVYRQLAANRPDLHNAALSSALTGLAEMLEVNGYRKEAAKARTEAASIRQ